MYVCIYVCTFIVSLLTNKMFPADKKCELIKNMIQKYDKFMSKVVISVLCYNPPTTPPKILNPHTLCEKAFGI